MTKQKTEHPSSGLASGLTSRLSPWLWVAFIFLALGLAVARILVPDMNWLTILLLVLWVADVALLIFEYRKSLTGRAAAHGLNSAVTILLVLGLVSLLNFLAVRYPQKLDMTQNKRHTLADQTVKLLKGLKQPINAVFFGTIQEKEKERGLLENYRSVTPQFQIEYSDPGKDIIRVKKENITRRGNSIDTVVLYNGDRSVKVEGPTEEKLTNALIKLTKDKRQELCTLIGHGERGFSLMDENGYDSVRRGLESQGYSIKEIHLTQDPVVPKNCDAVAIAGPTKAFFEPEIKAIAAYLDDGGRAVVALDPVLEGPDNLKALKATLEDWHVKVKDELILDPVSASKTRDLAVILIPIFSKDHVITRGQLVESYFPAARPLEADPHAPAGLNVQWLAKTLPTAWGETDLKGLKTGKILQKPPSKDGLVVAFAVEGKKPGSKASRNTRIVVFGSSGFAANGNSQFGSNLDFFLNASSWVLEDESMISIHPKEEGSAKVMMSGQTLTLVGLVVAVIIPLAIVISGIVVWVRRKRL